MNRETVKKELREESIKFTLKEIWEIMDEESNKDPSEMDTELIDECVRTLEKGFEEAEQNNKEEGVKRKYFKLKKLVLIAAVISMMFAVIIPVSAKYIDSEVSNKIVRFYANHFKIDLRTKSQKERLYPISGDELVKELAQNGFVDLLIPKNILNFKYSAAHQVQNTDFSKIFVVDFFDSDLNIYGSFKFSKVKNSDLYPAGSLEASENCNKVEIMKISEHDIALMSEENEKRIIYIDNNIEYIIVFNDCDYSYAYKIIKSLE